MHTAIIVVSVLMLALAMAMPLFFLATEIMKRKPVLGSYVNFWELFIVTVYLPCLWFGSFVLVKIINHFSKG